MIFRSTTLPQAPSIPKPDKAGSKDHFSWRFIERIDDPEAIKGHEGHHVSVVAKVNDADKTIHISKVTMLAQGAPTGPSEMH